MNVDEMLRALNQKQVDYLLIGGTNFLLRHLPELTFDVDIWVQDDADNLEHVNSALEKLHTEWGRTESG
jgi:predicted nucleotidyltransferase